MKTKLNGTTTDSKQAEKRIEKLLSQSSQNRIIAVGVSKSIVESNPGILRAMRVAANLTQREMAEITGMSQQSIAYWENGTRVPAGETPLMLLKALFKQPMVPSMIGISKGLLFKIKAITDYG